MSEDDDDDARQAIIKEMEGWYWGKSLDSDVDADVDADEEAGVVGRRSVYKVCLTLKKLIKIFCINAHIATPSPSTSHRQLLNITLDVTETQLFNTSHARCGCRTLAYIIAFYLFLTKRKYKLWFFILINSDIKFVGDILYFFSLTGLSTDLTCAPHSTRR